MRAYYYRNTHTGEVYCSANCAVYASLEGALSVMSDERFAEFTQDTSIHMSDIDNLAVLNARVTDADACGEVVIVRGELDPDAVTLCDRCFCDLDDLDVLKRGALRVEVDNRIARGEPIEVDPRD